MKEHDTISDEIYDAYQKKIGKTAKKQKLIL